VRSSIDILDQTGAVSKNLPGGALSVDNGLVPAGVSGMVPGKSQHFRPSAGTT
jgi:hypothetical protein